MVILTSSDSLLSSKLITLLSLLSFFIKTLYKSSILIVRNHKLIQTAPSVVVHNFYWRSRDRIRWPSTFTINDSPFCLPRLNTDCSTRLNQVQNLNVKFHRHSVGSSLEIICQPTHLDLKFSLQNPISIFNVNLPLTSVPSSGQENSFPLPPDMGSGHLKGVEFQSFSFLVVSSHCLSVSPPSF